MEQIGIALFGVLAIVLTQSRCAHRRRWACIAGMLGQPFWYWSAWHAGQMGVLFVSVLYTLAWGRGIWQHWIRRV